MNIPNLLSVFRMTLAPVFVAVFFSDGSYSNYYAAGVYALAGLTDAIDGIIARSCNQITDLGKVLDPLADKLMTITVFICLTIEGIIPWWAIALIFAKDMLLVAGGVSLYRKMSAVFAANWLGKSTTVFLVLGGIVIMTLDNILPEFWKNLYLYLAICLSLLSFSSYLYQYICFKNKKINF